MFASSMDAHKYNDFITVALFYTCGFFSGNLTKITPTFYIPWPFRSFLFFVISGQEVLLPTPPTQCRKVFLQGRKA